MPKVVELYGIISTGFFINFLVNRFEILFQLLPCAVVSVSNISITLASTSLYKSCGLVALCKFTYFASTSDEINPAICWFPLLVPSRQQQKRETYFPFNPT